MWRSCKLPCLDGGAFGAIVEFLLYADMLRLSFLFFFGCRGMERVDFGWYAKKMSLPTLAGFFAGIGTYLLGTHVHLPNMMALVGQ